MNYAEACRIGPVLIAKYYRPAFTPIVMPPPKPVETAEQRRIRLRRNYQRWHEKHRKATYIPLPGEVTMKQWLLEEAARIGLTTSAIFMRLTRGKYPNLQVRRVNRRVAYVKVHLNHETISVQLNQ